MNLSKILLVSIALSFAGTAAAESGCTLKLKPETKGFFLNPTVVKVVVDAATPRGSEPCRIQAGDELLQLNERTIPGSNAKALMAYWKGLPSNAPRTFKVRRAGTVMMIHAK